MASSNGHRHPRAVRRIEVIPRAGTDPDVPALFWREPRQSEIVEVNEAVKECPEGSIFTASRPSVKST